MQTASTLLLYLFSGQPVLSAELLELCHNDAMRAELPANRTLEHAARLGLPKAIAQKLFDMLLGDPKNVTSERNCSGECNRHYEPTWQGDRVL